MNRKKKQPGILYRLINTITNQFRRVDGVELPREGRSSIEGDGSYGSLGLSAVGSVLPDIPNYFEMLKDLKCLSVFNPDFSQMIGTIVALGNTGHQITVDAQTDTAVDAAMRRINESASRLYDNGAGVDGLINAYLRQSATYGAISSEDVIDFGARRVEKVVIVPVCEIRFRRLDGKYVPHQQPKNWMAARGKVTSGPLGLIPLNPNTYHYYALETIENSPYAKPPASAALEILQGPQEHAIQNVKHIVQKLGILGLVMVKVARDKPKKDESDSQYASRMQKFLDAAREVLSGNFRNGLLIAFDNFKFEHANVASDARGAERIIQVIEEWAFSGMGSMAWMHGRNYTTTETFADVVYNILLSQRANHLRLAKRRLEQTDRLDLMLAGIPVDGVSVEFNRAEARDEVKKAKAEQIRQAMALERRDQGITSPDQCAQELGYEEAFDPEIGSSKPGVAANSLVHFGANARGISATCRFDRDSQRYRLLPSRIEIAGEPVEAGGDEKVVEFKKKAAA